MPLPKILNTHVTAGLAAIELRVSRQYVNALCRAGKVPGAVKVSDGGRGIWLIPCDVTGLPLIQLSLLHGNDGRGGGRPPESSPAS